MLERVSIIMLNSYAVSNRALDCISFSASNNFASHNNNIMMSSTLKHICLFLDQEIYLLFILPSLMRYEIVFFLNF